MIYRPTIGSMWDPSVFWHNGYYYAIMMYNPDGANGLDATCGLISKSADGVHWQDGWQITPELDLATGTKFFKAFIARVGSRFILNHGVYRPNLDQDTLRFYESDDLQNWRFLFSSFPDPRWYEIVGRWDHMYMLPKEEDNPAAGYWGYPVATTRPGMTRSLGMMETVDGSEWNILPPPEIEWGNVPPRDLEIGGCERIGGKYIVIGGISNYLSSGYAMYSLIGETAQGPFRPDEEMFRLCGTSSCAAGWGVSFLAAWARGENGELLISNYVSVPLGTWMLPLRKALFTDGHLRLAWWPVNDALKGERIADFPTECTVTSAAGEHNVYWFEHTFDLTQGGIVEGTVCASAVSSASTAGFAFAENDGQAMEIRLGIGNTGKEETHVGRYNGITGFNCEDVTGQGCATLHNISDGGEHSFRLLVRHDIFELYVDDLLVQTYVYKPNGGRIGLITVGAKVIFNKLAAYLQD